MAQLSRAKRAEILKLENEQLRAKADQLAEEATNLRALHQADRRRIAELEMELVKCKR